MFYKVEQASRFPAPHRLETPRPWTGEDPSSLYRLPAKAPAVRNRANQFTRDMVFGKTVQIDPVTTVRYGRTVAWVSVNGESLNKGLVRAVLAWWYRKYARDDTELERLENEAREAKRGLWVDPNPVPPWEWRR